MTDYWDTLRPLPPVSDDWQVVRTALMRAPLLVSVRGEEEVALNALARLREREAQLNEEGHALRGREVALEKRIRELERENKRLLHESIPNDNSPYAEAERRVARLEAALQRIKDGAESNPAHEIAEVAREALTWYAERDHSIDGGARARRALAHEEEKEEA